MGSVEVVELVAQQNTVENPRFPYYSQILTEIAAPHPRSLEETRTNLSHFVDSLLLPQKNGIYDLSKFNVEEYYEVFKAEARRQMIAALESRAANNKIASSSPRRKPDSVPLYDTRDRFRDWFDRYGNFAKPALQVLMNSQLNSLRLRLLAKVYIVTTWDFSFLAQLEANKAKVIGRDGHRLGPVISDVLEASLDKYVRYSPYRDYRPLLEDCMVLQSTGVWGSYIPEILTYYYQFSPQPLDPGLALTIAYHFNAYLIQGDVEVFFRVIRDLLTAEV